jgi:hypothetical protein
LRKTIKAKTGNDETAEITTGPLGVGQKTVNNNISSSTTTTTTTTLAPSHQPVQSNIGINKLGNRFSMFEQNSLMSASSSSFSNVKPVLPKKPESANPATSPTAGFLSTLVGDNQRLSEEFSEEAAADTGSIQEPQLVKPSSIINKPLPPLPPNKPPRPLFTPTSNTGK